jgi:hypothetical protein
MAPPTSEEDPRHAPFLNHCLLYADFNRPVLLNAILRWFVESADANELKRLRHAIRDRAKALRRPGKKGRPRAEHTLKWISASARLVWQREILHWPWPKIAAAAGLKPTKPNLRTLQNRRDHYAMLVWRAASRLTSRADQPEVLSKMLDSTRNQRWFRSQLGLPFDTHPEECRKIVLALIPRGLAVEANQLRLPAGRSL